MRNAKIKDRRLVKGAIIGTAAIALLIGGGSFALWNDEASVSGDAVNSGELSFDLPSAGTWTLNGDPVTMSSALIVPRDVLQLTQPVHIVADGTQLTADFTIDATGVALDALGQYLNISYTLGAATGISGGPGTYAIDGSPRVDATVNAVVTISFDDVTGLTAQDLTVDLDAVSFELVQTSLLPAP